MKAAEEVSSKWKGTTANGGKTKNYIGGEFVDSSAKKWLEVRDPVCLRNEIGAVTHTLVNSDFGQHGTRDY
jgi:hypothetical protein